MGANLILELQKNESINEKTLALILANPALYTKFSKSEIKVENSGSLEMIKYILKNPTILHKFFVSQKKSKKGTINNPTLLLLTREDELVNNSKIEKAFGNNSNVTIETIENASHESAFQNKEQLEYMAKEINEFCCLKENELIRIR